jgi:acetyl esterase/lipase
MIDRRTTHPMRHTRFLLLLALPCAVLAAERDDRLRELLKRYPEADVNKDGVLTMEEAQAHAKTIRRDMRSPTAAVNDDGLPPSAAGSGNRPAPTHADVSYGPHERNKLDLWQAKSDGPTPLVVYIHGGGFVNGSKAGASAAMIRGCLDAGVSFMAINYRFRASAPLQDILRDCARSIQYIRYKAKEYNIDPTRIASYGGSAGAGTSLWLAFHPDLADPKSPDPVLRQSSRLAAAGAINTQATYNTQRWAEFLGTPMTTWERPGEMAALYGFKDLKELEEARGRAILADVDMLALISKDDAPVFMYSSQPDGEAANRGHYVHHPNHARTVKKACDAAGVPATAWFAMTEPRLDGDHQVKLREFLFAHLKVTPGK